MRNPFKPASAPAAFFWTHAGYSHNPATETPEQGRKRGAQALADAALLASLAGVSFGWQVDPDTTSADWIEGRKDGSRYRDPWATWGCVLRGPDGVTLASLWGIDFGRGGEPWGEPYRRVVEAELAYEATEALAAILAPEGEPA